VAHEILKNPAANDRSRKKRRNGQGPCHGRAAEQLDEKPLGGSNFSPLSFKLPFTVEARRRRMPL
jgi:hypothetical protein